MAFTVVKLQLASVLCVCATLATICSLGSCFVSGSGSYEYQMLNDTMSSTFDEIGGDLFLAKSGTYLPGTLGSYMKSSTSSTLNLSDTGLFVLPDYVLVWERSNDGVRLLEASLSVAFTMNVYTTQLNNSSRLVFAILPGVPYGEAGSMEIPMDGSSPPSKSTSKTVDGGVISVRIGGTTNRKRHAKGGIVWVEVTIEPSNSSSAGNYTVQIDYDRVGHHMSVYVVDVHADKLSEPSSLVANITLNMSDTMGQVGFLSLSSSMGQLLRLDRWSSTVEKPVRLLSSPACAPPSPSADGAGGSQRPLIIWLASVLGSAAVTVILATAVYCYFNSKYRRWKKDLDKLTKSMKRLPGMPTQFNFNDVKKATNNFHETMKLGRGGFGAVYRCRLPTDSLNGEVLDAAIKKFTRHDSRRYEDFLSEVSIINRLRHKNIVPLIGWSYNRGVPLLIYEYMPNGSLDQHLFNTGGNQHEKPNPMNQWNTRYNIVKDIATGLHYVHHEYEPMVLHRDIKASNIMIDSTYRGRLGDFGLACVLPDGKNSYTDQGAPGTLGFRALEYIHSGKATIKTDIFAFGVLVLEIVTGKKAVGQDAQSGHITDWVWNLHQEGNLLGAVDAILTARQFDTDEVKRLLLLGLACSSPNPSDRPSMVEALQVITKSASPPDVPLEKPRFVWPPEDWPSISSDYSTSMSNVDRSSAIVVEMGTGEHASSQNQYGSLHDNHRQEGSSDYHTANASVSDKY